MEPSLYWEANSQSASQEILLRKWDPSFITVFTRVHQFWGLE